MQKVCALCGFELNISEFPCSTNCRTFKQYHMKHCRPCRLKLARTVRALEKIHPRPPPGSPCELCKRKEKCLVLDHDHDTGNFRGYLCIRCNASACSYSIPELEDTIVYLKKHVDQNGSTTTNV